MARILYSLSPIGVCRLRIKKTLYLKMVAAGSLEEKTLHRRNLRSLNTGQQPDPRVFQIIVPFLNIVYYKGDQDRIFRLACQWPAAPSTIPIKAFPAMR